METSKLIAFLFSMLFISSATPTLGCGGCDQPSHGRPSHGHKPKPYPPAVKPPGILPPVILPPILNPPVTVPPVVKPPVYLPPVTLPPVVKPPVNLPPVTLPPVVNPPITNPPSYGSGGKPCPTPPATCPIDTLKLGACVDILGGLIHIGLGDPAVNECCPVIQGLVELEAAACLCTTLKIRALNLNLYVPLALQLLITCGKTPPPGYTCSV
ncbi:unnamed protein product [Cuscuta europaea]|uniref:Bifunctional inhibitor/plant lipid transfer protein/seed storage helical domain-containing protein n=1 Tax=Cuscuta europaea TaxID=41803 RepID=A0A9P1EJ01_CUSEU|nr:unnamed protein product [Cuscuta europaea]